MCRMTHCICDAFCAPAVSLHYVVLCNDTAQSKRNADAVIFVNVLQGLLDRLCHPDIE